MSIYAIVLQVPDETAWDKVRETWPDRHYIWHDYTAFIAPVGITTSTQLAGTLGFNGDEKRTGVVIEVTPSHHGYVQANLVEWLKNAGKEGA